MIRDIDRHFLKTDQSIFVDIGVYENETAYNRVCVIGGYNQLVELEELEPYAPNVHISTSCNWLTFVCSEFAT